MTTDERTPLCLDLRGETPKPRIVSDVVSFLLSNCINCITLNISIVMKIFLYQDHIRKIR